jgi:hypothetical protein
MVPPQDAIGKGVLAFRDFQVGGDDDAPAFVSFGDHLVEVLVLDAGKCFEPEVVDDQQIDAGKFGKLPLEALARRAENGLVERGGKFKSSIIR